jgi:DNA-3-methyladenine glycosylase
MNRIAKEFYLREDVVLIARELLGKILISFTSQQYTAGIITETEAYNGIIDKASHAYGGRRTKRTETMYREGGIAYVYLCYGIHSLLNVVTNVAEVPHAVLVRSVYPLTGIDIMEQRIGRKVGFKEGTGPGRVTRLLDIHYKDDGENLITGNKIWIEDIGVSIPESEIICTPRIGVNYAEEDALLPYRFQVSKGYIMTIGDNL